MWMKHGVQSICNLLTDPFLYCKTFGEKPYHAGELGNPDNVFVGNVSNVRHPIERESMVFTQRIKGNGALDYLAKIAIRFATAFRVKDAQELGIALISFSSIKQCLNKASWGILRRRCI